MGEEKESPRGKRASRNKPTAREKRRRPSDGAASRGEVIQRRVMAVVILVAVAVAIMALTDAAPLFDDVTEEERVTETVERFFTAVEDRDAETVCSLFSDAVVRSIELAGATETERGEPRGCPEILEARFAADEEADEESGEGGKLSVKIESVRVSGPRAVAEVILKTEQAPRGRSLPVELEQTPDGWLITRQVITG